MKRDGLSKRSARPRALSRRRWRGGKGGHARNLVVAQHPRRQRRRIQRHGGKRRPAVEEPARQRRRHGPRLAEVRRLDAGIREPRQQALGQARAELEGVEPLLAGDVAAGINAVVAGLERRVDRQRVVHQRRRVRGHGGRRRADDEAARQIHDFRRRRRGPLDPRLDVVLLWRRRRRRRVVLLHRTREPRRAQRAAVSYQLGEFQPVLDGHVQALRDDAVDHLIAERLQLIIFAGYFDVGRGHPQVQEAPGGGQGRPSRRPQ